VLLVIATSKGNRIYLDADISLEFVKEPLFVRKSDKMEDYNVVFIRLW
jgi:hypothetical protein